MLHKVVNIACGQAEEILWGLLRREMFSAARRETKDSLRKQESVKVHPSYLCVIEKLNVCASLCRMMCVKKLFSFFPVCTFSLCPVKSQILGGGPTSEICDITNTPEADPGAMFSEQKSDLGT